MFHLASAGSVRSLCPVVRLYCSLFNQLLNVLSAGFIHSLRSRLCLFSVFYSYVVPVLYILSAGGTREHEDLLLFGGQQGGDAGVDPGPGPRHAAAERPQVRETLTTHTRTHTDGFTRTNRGLRPATDPGMSTAHCVHRDEDD